MKLIAFIVPPPKMFFARGTHNGYVAVPLGHPCYQGDYYESPLADLEVHGGITYSEPCFYEKIDGVAYRADYTGLWNSLLEEAEYITEDKAIPNDWWIVGFDTCHLRDNPINWNRERVIAETLRLKEQLEQLSTN